MTKPMPKLKAELSLWPVLWPVLRLVCQLDVLLPQQAQTVELISGHTYIRKRISLTFFVKKLILWSEGLSQDFVKRRDLFCM